MNCFNLLDRARKVVFGSMVFFAIFSPLLVAATEIVSEKPQLAVSCIRQEGTRRWLEVDGQPFLVLAVQPDAWVMAKPTESAARQFAYARELAANTIQVPISWINVEPEKDRYTMNYIQWVLDQAQKNDLKVALVWLGSNAVGKTNSPTGLKLVPDYISTNTTVYSRVGGSQPDPKNVLDPADPDTLERESRACEHLFRFLAAGDRQRRVVLWQTLNEVGVDPAQKMRYSEVEFTRNLVSYAGALTRLEKRILGVPAYMNFWEGLKGAKPFAFLDGIPELDFVGHDLYGKPGQFHQGEGDYQSFRSNFLKEMARYGSGRNLIFVPETNTDKYYRSDLSAFYIAAHPAGVGLGVWAVTHGSHRGFESLVNPKTDRLTESGKRLREVYRELGKTMGPIVRARGTGRLGWFVSEGGEARKIKAGTMTLDVTAEPQGALIAVQQEDGSLILVGRKTGIVISDIMARKVERGRFEKDRWVGGEARAVEGSFGTRGLALHFDSCEGVRISSASGEGKIPTERKVPSQTY